MCYRLIPPVAMVNTIVKINHRKNQQHREHTQFFYGFKIHARTRNQEHKKDNRYPDYLTITD